MENNKSYKPTKNRYIDSDQEPHSSEKSPNKITQGIKRKHSSTDDNHPRKRLRIVNLDPVEICVKGKGLTFIPDEEQEFFTGLLQYTKNDITNWFKRFKYFMGFTDTKNSSSDDQILTETYNIIDNNPYKPSVMTDEDKTYGNNFFVPTRIREQGELRPIFIDGSNVAFNCGEHKYFSVEGLKTCIDFFIERRHEVKAFVPQFRQKKHKSTNPSLLNKLIRKQLVITTPSRRVNGKRFSSYDDWYIVQAAALEGGIIVSSDNYRDIMKKNCHLIPVIENRILVPTFVNGIVMFPNDPLGKDGPDLDTFLKF